jgi:PAS domain S-box-containing protein
LKPAAFWRSTVFSYVFAVVVSGLTLAARLNLVAWLGDRPVLVLFVLPIILSAYAGGLGPGLVATAVSTAGIYWFLLPPEHLLWFEGSVDLWQWIILMVVGILVSLLINALHRARNQAETMGQMHAVTLASIGDAVITTDARGRVTFLNGEAEQLTGWPHAEALGQPLPTVFRIINEATRATAENPVEKVFRTGAVADLANHTVLIARNGREYIIDDSGAPIRQADGRIIGVVLVFRDNTQKKRAEDALRQSQALYHSLVDQMPAGVFRKDASGRYVFVNSFFCRLRHATPEMFLGKLPVELPATEDPFKVQAANHHAQIMATGQPLEVLDEYHRTDGETLYFHVVKSPVFDAEGKVVGSQGVLLDVTAGKRIEASLRKSEEILAEVIRRTRCIVNFGEVEAPEGWREHALDAHAPFHWNFNVLNLDTAQEIMPLELQPGESTYQQAWVRSRHPDDHAQMNRNSGQALLDGAPFYRNEFRCTDRHGSEHWMQQQVSVRQISEGRWQIFGIATDVTELKTTQERFRQEHALLRTMIDLLPDSIYVKDTESRFLVVNEALAKNFGRPIRKMLGRSDADFYPAEMAAQWRAIELKVLAGTPLLDYEADILLPDGRTRTMLHTKLALHDDQNGVRGLVGIARDITEAKTAAQALRESESRLSTIFHSSPIGIVITRIADGLILDANEAFASVHGYTLDEAIGQTSLELGIWGQPEQREQMIATLRQEGRCRNQEIKFRKKDGAVGDLLISVEVVQFAGEECALGLELDITERKQSREVQMQLATIVQSSEDAIISKTMAGIITTWNRGAELIFGYPADEAIGQPMLMLFPPDRRHEEPDIMARIARGESVEHFVTERVRKNGSRLRISATISPLKDSLGKIVGASTIARDITHQQILEEQLRQSQKMEAIGLLAGGVAHDFNNILAVIEMQAELLKIQGNFSPEQLGCIDEIQTAASRAANLTRQLLLFSRRQRLQPRELDLSDSITAMTKMLRRILGEDIQMQFKYAPQPLFILADAGMMDQVLMNLTVNSRDAMPDGGLLIIETAAVEFDKLAAAQSSQARPGAFVRLSVSDTGCGIPPEILPRIFEPFFTTKDVGKGTGLGLATVFSIVQQHQGWINVYSEPGQGTAFHIYLPRLAKKTAVPAAGQSTLAAAAGGNETILLVEDDDALRAAVQQALSQLGYRLLEAAHGSEALAVWENHRAEIHLLLTDLVMPGGMSGKELSERLRQENPKLKVIYTSGYSAEVVGKDFPLEEGVNFLAKPFPAQALAQTVRNCLNKA